MANSVDPDQTAPMGAVCSGSTLFASILNSSVMIGNYLQQTTSADNIFRCIFFLRTLRVKTPVMLLNNKTLSFIFIPTFLLEESVYYIPSWFAVCPYVLPSVCHISCNCISS